VSYFQYYMEMASQGSTFRGFRTEDFAGEEYRDLLEVVEHETETLGNSDIPDYLKKHKIKDYKKYINDIYKQGYTECLWLVRSLKQLEKTYVREMMRHEGDFDYDEYIIKDPIILSDDEEFGQLVAYKPKNLKGV